jgi:hypothetical protein
MQERIRKRTLCDVVNYCFGDSTSDPTDSQVPPAEKFLQSLTAVEVIKLAGVRR